LRRSTADSLIQTEAKLMETTATQRRLAAAPAADMPGFSTLMPQGINLAFAEQAPWTARLASGVSLQAGGLMRALVMIVCVLVGITTAAAQETGVPKLGLEVATESCASCHAVLRVENRSPNPNAPPFAQIADIPGMSAKALQVALQSPHNTMPT